MRTCCRCNNTAGFWVMALGAKVVRRPWCLSCIGEFLDKDQVTVTSIEAAPRARRALARRALARRALARGEMPVRPGS
jgi:hypothetical protein